MTEQQILGTVLNLAPPALLIVATLVLPGLAGRRALFLAVCTLVTPFATLIVRQVAWPKPRVIYPNDPVPLIDYIPLIVPLLAIVVTYYVFLRAKRSSFEPQRQNAWANIAYIVPLVLLSPPPLLTFLAIIKFQGWPIRVPSLILETYAYLAIAYFWWKNGTICPSANSLISKFFRGTGLVLVGLSALSVVVSLAVPFIVRGGPGAGVASGMALWLGAMVGGNISLFALASFEIARWLTFSPNPPLNPDAPPIGGAPVS